MAHLAARRDSLEPATRWSTRIPSRRRGVGRNAGDGASEVVDAVHRLDDDAELAEIVAPHVLEQLGVVACPRPRSGSPAATLAGPAGPASDPEAVKAVAGWR